MTDRHVPALPRPVRVALALVLGGAFGTFALEHAQRNVALTPPLYTDFAYVWAGARAWHAGLDPYTVVGYHQAFPVDANLLYPAPALVVATPLAPLSAPWANAVFAGVSLAALAYLLSARGFAGLLPLASFPVWLAAAAGQWSPLLTVAALVPALGGLLICKPTIGAALALYALPGRRWFWRALIGGAVLTAIAFAVQPDWPARLVAGAARPIAPRFGVSHTGVYRAMGAILPAGPLLLLALLRWRRPEARLLAAFALVPHAMLGYELVPILALVPATPWQSAVLVAGSWAILLGHRSAGPSYQSHFVAIGEVTVYAVMLPALVMVLRRPNAGTVPAWLDRWAGRWSVRRLTRPRPGPTP